ncbi:hypothetical protein Tco_0727903, partial [Tanacetum coccineum]
AKTGNGEVQLQALVDGKKIIITEATVRRDLQLEDANGVDCLPNAIIFEKLTLMGMVKNLENVSGNFLMYPRFMQVFLEQKVGEMSNHKRIYVTPSHTKKIFGNMRRVGKGFSGRETPLFPTMVKQRARNPKRKDTEIPQSSGPTYNVANEVVNEEKNDCLERDATTATSLDAKQDRGNIDKTQPKATPNEPSSLGTSLGGGPKHRETIGDTSARTRFKTISKLSNDPLLARGEDLQQESTKKQKMDDVEETAEVVEDKETVKLQSLMKIFPDEEEVSINVIPLATKPLSIVDWKIIKEGKISYFQIIRADGSSKSMDQQGQKRVLWGDLRIMFEHHVEDIVWRNLQGNKVLI